MRPTNYLSVCSGIEAATVAWHPLGWTPIAFSEIEAFPAAVLNHHWPHVPNLGDMTRFAEWGCLSEVDGLVGGTPCQAFSVAGLRNSLDDVRGNLTLTYVRMLDEIDRQRNALGRPPAFCLWENVPGVLSTKDNAFGCFLGGLAGSGGAIEPPNGGWAWANAGYVRGPIRTIAWRVLDAQYFGVAQRRRRVFVVASADPRFRPEQVLFEREGVRRDIAPSREAGKGYSGGFEAGPCGVRGTDLAPTLDTRCKDGPIRNQVGCGVVSPSVTSKWAKGCGGPAGDECQNLVAQHMIGGFDYENNAHGPDDATGTLLKGSPSGGDRPLPAVCFGVGEVFGTLRAKPGSGFRSDGSNVEAVVATQSAVRRLTPEECETLQGFPHGHTRIPWRGKPAADCPDGPRYKAIGNSMAVPCMAHIGERLDRHLRQIHGELPQ
jgi:DNA (cytosine-5)-methyltransferase 1